MEKSNKRSVFFISDRTGITAEALGNSLITQFEGVEFNQIHMPFINTLEKAQDCVLKINKIAEVDDNLPLIFSTQINQKFRKIIESSNGVFFDFFKAFISKMEKTLDIESSHTSGRSHGINHNKNYYNRMNSVNFTLNGDDGMNPKTYKNADIILIGVSRSGKTPTCLYMALQYGIKAANYPLIEQDLTTDELPSVLKEYKNKIFGLTINPDNLQKIRENRRSNSLYSSHKQCQKEVKYAKDIFYKNNIPFIDTTQSSIEEISAIIINKLSLRALIL